MTATDATGPRRTDLKIAVVLNPRAGGGRAARRWPQLERAMREVVGPITVFESLRQGHVRELVQNALRDGFNRIVSAGGDGTVYEAVNGFFDGSAPINPSASLAIVPTGTGCDFARTIGVREGLGAIPLIGKLETVAADVGRVSLRLPNDETGVRYFLNVADVGMGGAVVQRANRSSKRFGGFATFLWSTVATLFTFRNCRLVMDVDGVLLEQTCRDVIIANGRYYGGGMHVAPEAKLDSGFFEVFAIGDISVPHVLLKLPKLYTGRSQRRPLC